MGELSGQVAVVTGGGHGIGRAIAQELAAAGAHVVLAGRQSGPLAATVAGLKAAGGAASTYQVDVTRPEQVEGMVAGLLDRHGHVDLLVNNAGRYKTIGPVWEADPAEWWQDVTVNLFGTFNCCRAFLKHMVARRGGKVINMSGGGSLGPIPYSTAYVASKAAIVRFTETVQAEVAEYGVNLYSIIPGFVKSGMTEALAASAEGLRWAPWLGERLARGEDYDPHLAGRLCVFLASPRGDRLGGRFLLAFEDYAAVAERADEVLAKDLYTLRRTSLAHPDAEPARGGALDLRTTGEEPGDS
ncbi:MAG: SDR family oxidoreductase [Chloroflexi bacterium]|nr:SDR family oxidoreductase [Chloroflexota bacterium]